MTWVNLNKIFNDVADEQGIEPGSKWWILGGLPAYSGQTGGNPSYGWRFDHEVVAYGLDYVKGVIANYGHRRIFYENAPLRNSGYLIGGRPIGYFPELPGDQPKGEAAYLTSTGFVLVSGPDAEHCEIGPLLALCDSTGYKVKGQGKDWDASFIAGMLVRYHVKSIRGFIMKQPADKTKPITVTDYAFGTRGASLILGALVESSKRGLIDSDDLQWLTTYVTKTTIPTFQLPGTLYGPPGGKGSEALPQDKPFSQLYNGIYWLLPRFYDAWKVAPDGELKDKLFEITHRLSQYMEDLEKAAPGKGLPSTISMPQEVVDGIDGKPVPSWAPYITAASMAYGSENPWGVRAQSVAAKMLNSDIMAKACAASVAKWKAKAATPNYKYTVSDKAWLVGADGEYL